MSTARSGLPPLIPVADGSPPPKTWPTKYEFAGQGSTQPDKFRTAGNSWALQ
jgi:hypothetical protein